MENWVQENLDLTILGAPLNIGNMTNAEKYREVAATLRTLAAENPESFAKGVLKGAANRVDTLASRIEGTEEEMSKADLKDFPQGTILTREEESMVRVRIGGMWSDYSDTSAPRLTNRGMADLGGWKVSRYGGLA